MLENNDSTHIYSYLWEASRKPGKFASPSTRNVLFQILQVLKSLQFLFLCFDHLYFVLALVKQHVDIVCPSPFVCVQSHTIENEINNPFSRLKYSSRKDGCCQPRKTMLSVPHKLTSSISENFHLCLACSSRSFEAF